MRVKNKIMDDRKKGVIYEIPCKDCEKMYVGEMGRTLKKRLYEHKKLKAVVMFDMNNGVAGQVHKRTTT